MFVTREERLKRDRERKARERAAESLESRERRLKRDRERKALSRSTESDLRREHGVAHQPEARSRNRSLEDPEARLIRCRYLANESAETRNRRLLEQRSRQMSLRSKLEQAKYLTDEDILVMNESHNFTPLTSEVEDELVSLATKLTSHANRKVCVVTDRWFFSNECSRVEVSALPIAAMQAVLRPQPWTTSAMIAVYDCSRFSPDLKCLLLSPRGFEHDSDNSYAWISNDALQHLKNTERLLSQLKKSSTKLKPPRFAICDTFVFGNLTILTEATSVEKQAIALAQFRGKIEVVFGGPSNILQSHVLCWDNREATIASSIPNIISEDNLKIILAGPFTSAQELLLMKRHTCDASKLRIMMALLKYINPLYEKIPEDKESLASISDTDFEKICVRLSADPEVERIIASARARMSSVTSELGLIDSNAALDETSIHVSETVLLSTQPTCGEATACRVALAKVTKDDNSKDTFFDVSDTLVARRSGKLLSSKDQHFFERLFPHLFPFGTSGIGIKRQHFYSKREIICHLLNLSTNAFAEDPTFKMVAFDYLSTQRVMNGVYVKIGQDPSLAHKAAVITEAQLSAAIDKRQAMRNAARVGRPILQTTSTDNSYSLSVLKTVSAGAKKMWGSNEEREDFKRKVDSMCSEYGSPSLFWTFTPNPDGSLLLAFWSAKDLPNGRPSNISDLSPGNMPNPSYMTKLVSGNAVLQAEYYWFCVKVLLEVYFGWDMEARKPLRRQCLFNTEALYFAEESQGRLRIHHHGVAWIIGMPRSTAEWETLMSDKAFLEKYESYSSSIFSSEMPIFWKTENQTGCSNKQCDGTLEAFPLDKKYRHLLKKNVDPPIVARCNKCATGVTNDEVISSTLDCAISQLGQIEGDKIADSTVRNIRLRPGGFSTNNQVRSIQLSKSLMIDQIHSFYHVPSCIKGSKSTLCRYRFPRPLVYQTGFEGKVFKRQRRIGNQWLNDYIPAIRRVFHFNMDSRLLLDGQGAQAALYATKYATKMQSILDNANILKLAVKKKFNREKVNTEKSTLHEQGVSRLLSLAYATSGVIEIGGPLVCHYLLRGAAGYFSCRFAPLFLVQALNIIEGKDVEGVLKRTGGHFFVSTALNDYIYRPEKLEEFSWYDFVKWYRRCSVGLAGNSNGHQDFLREKKKLFFQPCHREFQTAYLTKKKRPFVPEIFGPRLPDFRKLTSDDQMAEKYYRCCLLLYRPFRTPTEILDNTCSARSLFLSWSKNSPPAINRRLSFHQQYYIGLDAAAEFRVAQREEEKEMEVVDTDIDVTKISPVNSERGTWAIYHSMLECLDDVIDSMDIRSEKTVNVVIEAENVEEIVKIILPGNPCRISTSPFDAPILSESVVLKYLRKVEQQITAQSQGNELLVVPPIVADTYCLPIEQMTTVIVEKLKNALSRCLFQERDGIHSLVPDNSFPTLAQVSSLFRLNRLQHLAFVIFCAPLLQTLAGTTLDSVDEILRDTSPVFVTGPGGTGKSRIVAAIKYLLRGWGRPQCLRIMATTGVAASQLQGMTQHHGTSLPANKTKTLPEHLSQPSQEMLLEWDKIHAVILDELSMEDCTTFGLWLEALSKLKEENYQCDWPRVHILLLGDHLQLSAIGGTPLFRSKDSRSRSLDKAAFHGHMKYMSITRVIYLEEMVRFADDPEWGQELSLCRRGIWTQNMRSILEKRSGSNVPISELEATFLKKFTSVVAPDNMTRQHVNHRCIMETVKQYGTVVYKLPARLSCSNTATDQNSLFREIFAAADNITAGLPSLLFLFEGMQIRIKANQLLSKGVANGATATVFHIDWPPDTTFHADAQGFLMPSKEPLNIFVNVDSAQHGIRYPHLPSSWPDTVVPICRESRSFQYTYCKIPISVNINQFPIIPGYGSTVFGIQGCTVDRLCAAETRPENYPNPDKNSLYVILSRVRTRWGLWIPQGISDSDYEYFVPANDLIVEDNRLKELSCVLIASFEQ